MFLSSAGRTTQLETMICKADWSGLVMVDVAAGESAFQPRADAVARRKFNALRQDRPAGRQQRVARDKACQKLLVIVFAERF
ncbi:MAG: hypothetical protein R3C59_23630 [Planctomycetaceae bacterium]